MTVRNVTRRLALGLTHGWLTDVERAALPATGGWKRRRLIELVKTVEIGPVAVAADRKVVFVVNVYKDLERKKRFFPIVSRRDSYRITPAFVNKPAAKQVDVIESRFRPEDFVHASKAAAMASIVREIRMVALGKRVR